MIFNIKRTIFYILYFCIVFIIPTFFLASGLVNLSVTIQYILIYISFYIIIYLYNKVFPIKQVTTTIGCVLPIVVVTCFGFYVNYEGLFPLIFPTSTIIFLFAFCQLFIKRIIFLNITSILLIVVFGEVFYPKITVNSHLVRDNKALEDYYFFSLIQQDSTDFYINENEDMIIDFMFINCKPCRDKLDYLQELGKEKNVYVIVDGKIDSYKAYSDFYKKNKKTLNNLTFLYDPFGKFTTQFSVTVYPMEIIIKNKHIIARDIGFPQHSKREYLNIRREILN